MRATYQRIANKRYIQLSRNSPSYPFTLVISALSLFFGVQGYGNYTIYTIEKTAVDILTHKELPQIFAALFVSVVLDVVYELPVIATLGKEEKSGSIFYSQLTIEELCHSIVGAVAEVGARNGKQAMHTQVLLIA